jgi:uncharacterized protein with PIN domain
LTKDSHPRLARAAEFRFYEELNDFLPLGRRKVSFMQPFHGTPAVRDVIQAIGVPHSAVDLLLVDGRSVDFEHRLQGGERVAVYPVFECLDITPLVHLRPQPLRRTRFVLDVHLGRLARYLRMLGFDCTWQRDWDDSQIIERALDERRIILTRDVGILKQKRVSHARPVAREDLAGRIDADIRERFQRFWECPACNRIYWQGSHWRRMQKIVDRVAPHSDSSDAAAAT